LSPIYQKGTILAFLLFLLVALTKRAQVPFTRWLPAAMAAPTPVRALVHSSTLVTAGIWLLVRFNQIRVQSSRILLMLGRVTLLLASTAALIEVDGKKVVALSTLRQLGLIFMALSLGNRLICLFHLLMHAFAKANLFLIVGNFLHIRFSQQDYRQLSSGVEGATIFLVIFVSVLRLRGIIFSRGFFSKDSILLREFNLIGSFLSWLILVRIISLTFAYCLKLIFSLALIEGFHLLTHKTYNPIILYPSTLLVILSIYLGYSIFNNIEYLMVISQRTSGLY
jgi:NADH:ubiquinone oxidoreductase subunit 5 (subunit L)/multisubunit Na+/H+ antiporter MnhA subunit